MTSHDGDPVRGGAVGKRTLVEQVASQPDVSRSGDTVFADRSGSPAVQRKASGLPRLQLKDRSETSDASRLAEPAATTVGAGDTPVAHHHDADEEHRNEPQAGQQDDTDRSARFDNDATMASVRSGTATMHQGGRGLSVTRLQQALVDLGYLLPRFGVDGIFEGETRAAVVRFQHDQHLPETGELDQATINALHARYDTRQPYVAAAAHNPANPGTRTLSAADRAAARDAMLPPRSGAAYQPTIPTNPDNYATRIQARLTTLIPNLHTRFFASRAPARANPANLDSWSTIEGPARSAKQATDTVYASNYGGTAAVPPLTHAGGNLLDRWDHESATQAAMDPTQLRVHAEQLVEYLIDSQCTDINREHSAVPSAATERHDLAPVITSFVDTPAKVQILNEIDIGWPGTQRGGQISLQRFRSQNTDPVAAKEENRVRLWRLFHTSIHEYLHLLAHPAYRTWAQTLDRSRKHTLMEGFCDFFTLNVRSALTLTPPMVTDIEGPYANGNPPPPLNPGVYPSHAQAEQVVSIVGIHNAQAAYFRGQVAAMGGP